MRLFLCSSGFDNDRLVPHFLKLFGGEPSRFRTLFIPTALNTSKAREYLPAFLKDLEKIGVPEEKVVRLELDSAVDENLLDQVGLVFVCPGDTEYLLDRMHSSGFDVLLKGLLARGLPYIGISAGADIIGTNHSDGLKLIDRVVECHAAAGSTDGPVDGDGQPLLLDENQALIVDGHRMEIVS